MPPTLYIDDWTVLNEIHVSKLRAGDHCIVALNILHRLWKWSDSLCSLLASWECLPFRFYHHFVVLDDVYGLSADGRPLRADGELVRIAEFSDTPAGAYRRLVSDGFELKSMLKNAKRIILSPASIHLPPLADYVSHRADCIWRGQTGRGIFVVAQKLSAEQRRRTVAAAVELASSEESPTYHVFSSNCEHLAWQLDTSSAYRGRWVSPQVPHNLWKLFRIGLNLVGIACLRVLAIAPEECGAVHMMFSALYHLFTTLPVAAQVQACLLRTAVNLTQRRSNGELERGTFEYLMIKEACRNAWVTLFGVGTIYYMPWLVWNSHGEQYTLAAALSFFAYNLAVITFNGIHQLAVRAMLASGVGVPIPVIEDLRIQPACAVTKAQTPRCTKATSRSFESTGINDHATNSRIHKRPFRSRSPNRAQSARETTHRKTSRSKSHQ